MSALLLLSLTFVPAQTPVDYLREVKPIFAAHCYACHGAIKQKGSLRLDTVAQLREGGSEGASIQPGKSSDSLLVRRVLGEKGLHRMPPAEEGEALKPAQVALIRKWIDEGATGPKDEQPDTDPKDHWAFKPPVRPAVPKPANEAWRRNPVDAFLAEQHDKHGLKPQPAVDKGLLLRRVHLDLVGLPPTRAQLNAFMNDKSPDAYEQVVEQLLASPQHAERWGRHWMDVWRYSDWWGLGAELRNSQKHIWHWRDWIVDSLQRDKGYDRMLREMLAADELFPNDADALRGTGFLARHYFKFNRTTWLDETIEHTGKAFLGLTVNCCKCHDHKYDPISQPDYYRFRAFFEPYQIRLDQAAGETDFEKDGVPRVFDCNFDTPTYLHVRGSEASPDKTRVITPGLPKIFGAKLDIAPVKLPREAYQPHLRESVIATYRQQTDQLVTAARKSLEAARARLASAPAEVKKPADEPGRTLVQDDFASLDPLNWTKAEGRFTVANGKLLQELAGDVRGALQLKAETPDDFEARFTFAILGGDQWRSVGIVFDQAGKNETLVYLTAHAPDQRVQVSYKQNGVDAYPADGAHRLAVPLNVPHEMALRVRGGLLNVAINGKHVLAYRLPIARQKGSLALITFDAKARFDRFTLATLPASTAMIDAAGKGAPATTQAGAKAAVLLAEKALAVAEAQRGAVEARVAADRAVALQPTDAATKTLKQQAARAEKQVAVAEAQWTLEKVKAGKAERKGPQTVKDADAEIAKVRKAVDTAGEAYTPLRGALKTLESNLESEASRLKPFPATSSGRRSALAQWVAGRDNPLAARVAVNHVWLRHFGQPLVPSVFDFGRKGTPPTHPALLDWLAVEFMEKGWSFKHLHRLLVTSSAYRMTSSSLDADASLAKDAENRFHWRMNTGRMESQAVRDSLLHLAGELDLTLGGPSIESAQQEASKRRSMYFFHSAIERNRFLALFDEADPLDCYRRRQSIVPQQALALANSGLAMGLAAKIADNLDQQLGKSGDADFAKQAFLLVLATPPADAELSACLEAMSRWRALSEKRPAAETQRRARTQLVQALLNHNDFVTVR